MNTLHERYPMTNHPGKISLIRTDFAEAEGFLCRLAEEERRKNPEIFTGKKPCVYHKLAYKAPYEQFGELRALIVDIQENTGLHASFQGLIAVDVSQWISHEDEEYFTVFLKYLYDHSYQHFALVITHCTDKQYQNMRASCARYIDPIPVNYYAFENLDNLTQLLTMYAAECSCRMSHDAAQALAKAVCENIRPELRSLTLIQRIANDTAAALKNENITKQQISQYLDRDNTIYAYLAVSSRKERRIANEREALQF